MSIHDVANEKLARWKAHPDIFVREVFGITPDAWQDDALEAFPHTPRLALKACAGPGKTFVLATLAWNFLLTRPNSRGGATSINGANLKAGLWAELAKLHSKSDILQAVFEMNSTTISAREAPKTWKLEARTWARDANADQIGNALRGIHGDFVIWLMDETGSYPDGIMPVCENIFSGDPIEAHIVQAGNPTKLAGPLYRACTAARNLWTVIDVTGDPDDIKRSPRIPIEHARAQIQQYGANSPWVLVNIFGKFPPHSLDTLIGPDECNEAMLRGYREQDIASAARVLGVDVSRFGDDASVIFPRQGLVAFQPLKYRNIDSTQGAGAVALKWTSWEADACFIDDTGGFGSGWIDALRRIGRTPIGIPFSGKATDPRYANRRAEMYFDAVDWIRRGGQLPKDCPELIAALTQTTYSFRGDTLLLEPKEMVKQRLGYSPDDADAFALTFAQPVAARRQYYDRTMETIERLEQRRRALLLSEYDVFAELDE